MDMSKRYFLIALVLVILVQLACNMPRGGGTPTPSGAEILYTAAAQTVEAQLTQVNQPPATAVGSPTLIPLATSTPGGAAPSPTTGLVPSDTPKPTGTPIPCDLVKFVEDVTYPDNTQVPPGASFEKTWRLQNAGTCTWNTSYSLAFAGGDAMGAPATVPLTKVVPPGDTVDVSVTLTAPDDSGTYRGNWMLRNPSNVLFGIGDGTKPFWVQIKVSVESGLLYDFLVNAGSAAWETGVGSDPGNTISFGGDDNDPNGVAKIKDQVKLESGATSGKVLLTYPKREEDGYIRGVFPAYKVQSGDRFKSRLTFMIPEGEADCGSGRVKFQLAYKEGDEMSSLKEWTKSCNGNQMPVEVDLSDLKGKTVEFILIVKADGSSSDDWAIWNSPRIEH
jgi:hypothetical protein